MSTDYEYLTKNVDNEQVSEPPKNEEPITVFRNVKSEPFDLYGFYAPHTEKGFKRLPDDLAQAVNSGVAKLYLNTAGGRVRFCTDSPYVIVRAEMIGVTMLTIMPSISSVGFDLYLDDPETGKSHFYNVFDPTANPGSTLERKIDFGTAKMRWITIHFPSYSGVTAMSIGLDSGATVGHGLRYRDVPPIVYYGSSITQGAAASRPGNSYENIICRNNNTDYLNLGFSSSGKGEENIARYLADLPMSVFVCDYDHNSPKANLEETHLRLYRIIRKKNPTVPYVMISRPDVNNHDYETNLMRRNAIYRNYMQALAEGDKNVYFVDGSSFFRTGEEDMCTVDGIHPNDYGMFRMADAIGSELRWIQARAQM